MVHFSLLLENDQIQNVKYENLSEDQKKSLDSFLTFESTLFKDLATAVVEINKIIASIAKSKNESGYSYDDNKSYKNYVSREDYKIFFGMTDEHIDMWEYYATEIMRKPELVKNMPKSSYIKMNTKKEKEAPK